MLSVPHAGRDYPAEMRALARLDPRQLRSLEDRHADALIAKAVGTAPALVATTPRVWIDLNRDEREFDPAMVTGATQVVPMASSKVRGGLGLVPRRIARGGDIWRGPLDEAEINARIAQVHRPYHAALSAELAAAHARFGVAILLDIHSMPPIADRNGEGAPRIVIGDRFGKAAQGRFTARALAEAEAFEFATAVNAPYAGGHILERHTAPHAGIHGLQIEIDRTLYLDPALDDTGAGLPLVQTFIEALVRALIEEALAAPMALAAE